MRRQGPNLELIAMLSALSMMGGAWADSLVAPSGADGTLISTTDGSQVANGAGPALFCGRVNNTGGGTLRRAVLWFDVSGIPAGSTITAVSLQLHFQSATPSAQVCTVHAVQAPWGEGESSDLGGGGAPATPGDATWSHREWPSTPWTTPGGDFAPVASASALIDGVGFRSFASTPQLVADVQAWVDNPASNFGVLIKGNEAVLQTTKKFDSRESAEAAQRPLLNVEFTPPPAIAGDLNGDRRVNGADLGLLLAAWGSAGPGDLNGNGTVDGADLGLLLALWTS